MLRIWHMDRSRRSLSHRLEEFYDVSRELGRGSYATVFKALHKAEKKWYAVKRIARPEDGRGSRVTTAQAGDPYHDVLCRKVAGRLRQLEREIDILKSLKHPHIVEFKEHFVEGSSIGALSGNT